MNDTVISAIQAFLETRGIPIYGVADADRLNRMAPQGFRPEDMLPDARSVVIPAKPLPLSVFQTPRNRCCRPFAGRWEKAGF